MPRKRFPKGQTKLPDPEVEALAVFKHEMEGPIFNTEVICPFCAFRGRVLEFRTKKSERSKGYSIRMFKCPDCGQKMRRETLLNEMTVSQWARWLYSNVIMYGGYHRISFPKLMERLKGYGWAREFWEAWKAIKEGRVSSDVEDYLEYLVDSSDAERHDCDNYNKGIAGRSSMFCVTCPSYKVCWPKELKDR